MFKGQVALMSACFLAAAAGSAHGQTLTSGPSSSQTPYLVGTQPGVDFTSILTVGDAIGGYRLVGILDGLGAWDNGDGTFNLVAHHELGGTAGIVRAHGQTGSFVSRWNIKKSDLTVNSGRDHNTSFADAFEWTGASWSNVASAAQRWNRFCSADLAEPSAFKFGSLGTDARILLGGEEAGNEGRAYGHILTGANTNKSYHLPALGRFSWENAVASPASQDKTVVIGLDDTTPGQIYVYVGTKTAFGNDVQKAGLADGRVFGVKVPGLPLEVRPSAASGRFELVDMGDVTNKTGASLQADSVALGITEFLRPEDGHWDPRIGRESDFYFLTTDRYRTTTTVANSRLYRLRFDNINDPAQGGVITMLVDGSTDGPQMMDNMCVDKFGRVIIQEDIGNQAALGRLWAYSISTDTITPIAQHDPARHTPGAPGFLTQDEESSGVIDANGLLGDGWYLLDVQAHYGIAGELVEGGQLLAMYIDPAILPNSECAGDLNADGLVDDVDFNAFALAYTLSDCTNSAMPAGCPSDLNNDNFVNEADFVVFSIAYSSFVCP
jgi:hypothetical protein